VTFAGLSWHSICLSGCYHHSPGLLHILDFPKLVFSFLVSTALNFNFDFVFEVSESPLNTFAIVRNQRYSKTSLLFSFWHLSQFIICINQIHVARSSFLSLLRPVSSGVTLYHVPTLQLSIHLHCISANYSDYTNLAPYQFLSASFHSR
jgi:hypothetical protein